MFVRKPKGQETWRELTFNRRTLSQIVMDQLNPGLRNLVNLGKSYEKSVTGKHRPEPRTRTMTPDELWVSVWATNGPASPLSPVSLPMQRWPSLERRTLMRSQRLGRTPSHPPSPESLVSFMGLGHVCPQQTTIEDHFFISCNSRANYHEKYCISTNNSHYILYIRTKVVHGMNYGMFFVRSHVFF